MSYSANQYNYATPLSSSTQLTSDVPLQEKKYFNLHDNVLDGTYEVITGDVGLWGNVVSDSDGVLSTPYVLTVTDALTVRAFRIIGYEDSYPVDFSVVFYNGNTALHTITEVGNTRAQYIQAFYEPLEVTKYTVTVTKINKAGSVLKLINAFNPMYLKRRDTAEIAVVEVGRALSEVFITRSDTIKLGVDEAQSNLENRIISNVERLRLKGYDVSSLNSIHAIMKAPTRGIYGKVYITYSDPMLDNEITVTATSSAHNSELQQIIGMSDVVSYPNSFVLYDNDLTGAYVLTDPSSIVGWTSAELSREDCTFANPQSVTVTFEARPVRSLDVTFDASHGCIATDFSVTFVKSDNTSVVKQFTNNADISVSILDTSIEEVVSVTLTITKLSQPNKPATIVSMPLSSTILYKGYADESKIMSIDLLEELTYDDDIEALGGVSANEVTVVLDNSDKHFTGPDSVVAKQLRRNRKIVPYLGVEIEPGSIEWYQLGVFWSHKWDLPINSLTAKVVGFDNIGLLSLTSYTNHQTQRGKSIGQLIEMVILDAKQTLSFLEYRIDPALYDVVIPFAWFSPDSHAAALRKISKCYPMHIYCDRQGHICAAPQKLHVDYYYDVWSDNTNVIDKTYSSLYTALPNIISVTMRNPVAVSGTQLARDEKQFTVNGSVDKVLNFSKPYLENLNITVDADPSVEYAYAIYSWGVVITFTGNGVVRTIECTGTCLDVSDTSTLTKRNENGIKLDGAITRTIESDFIQTEALATLLIDRFFELSENDKYDVKVNYRGDISLTINDPIRLKNGIAPTDRYNIKRHQLSWNGSLTGSADLNT